MRPDLTSLTRKPGRGSSSRDRLDTLLDDELVGTLATVVDVALPITDGSWLYKELTGGRGSRPRSTRAGAASCR